MVLILWTILTDTVVLFSPLENTEMSTTALFLEQQINQVRLEIRIAYLLEVTITGMVRNPEG